MHRMKNNYAKLDGIYEMLQARASAMPGLRLGFQFHNDIVKGLDAKITTYSQFMKIYLEHYV